MMLTKIRSPCGVFSNEMSKIGSTLKIIFDSGIANSGSFLINLDLFWSKSGHPPRLSINSKNSKPYSFLAAVKEKKIQLY